MTNADGGALRQLRLLLDRPRFSANVAAVEEVPARAARHGEWPSALAAEVVRAAARLGFSRPYSHQSDAIEAVLAGRDVVVSSGTASGKSLAYVVPMVQALAAQPEARALLIFPTKALARDQLAALREWDKTWPELGLAPAVYDGDTPRNARAQARRHARVVLTNPDMLHAGILPRHVDWERLLGGLSLVALDEAHVYRGVFGSHVANVVRRLRRLAEHYGSDPRFVLTSATIGNPSELAQGLIGRAVTLVRDDGSPSCARTLALYNPPVVDETLGIRRSALLEAEALARHFAAGGVQTIVFAQSRQSAELIVRYLSDGLAAEGQGESVPVRGYRAGYMPSERRQIEADLRSGRLRAVVATNALELGIDIGRLDACVMAGYPGTIASTRQQAGRAGRREGHAAAILVAGMAPIDQYLMRHPEYLLGGSPEQARIDPDNLLVLLEHVRCAAYELPFDVDEAATPLGPPSGPGTATSPSVAEMLDVLATRGEVVRKEDRWYWIGASAPAASVGLRSSGPDTVTIVETSRPVDVLATVDRAAAASTVHQGAIYLHDATSFEVLDFDWEAGRATVRQTDGSEYTRASSRTDLRPIVVSASRSADGAIVHHGELEVRRRVTGYRRIRLRTHETLGYGQVDLPEHKHLAGGYWFVLDDATVARLESLGHWHCDPAADRGPNWPEQRRRALERDGYRCRLCNAPQREGRSHDVHHIRPYDSFAPSGGTNGRHLQANMLSNLITLCHHCHGVAERALGLHTALGGLGYSLRHMSALFLMCDSRDLEVSCEAHAPWTGRPTVAVYERASGGVGFGPALYDRHEELLAAARDVIAACVCKTGCPSCVGPAQERGPDAKTHALAVLDALAASPGHR